MASQNVIAIREPTLKALENLAKPDPRSHYKNVSNESIGWFVATGGMRLLSMVNDIDGVSICLDQTEGDEFVAEMSSKSKNFVLTVSREEECVTFSKYHMAEETYQEGRMAISGSDSWEEIAEMIDGFFFVTH